MFKWMKAESSSIEPTMSHDMIWVADFGKIKSLNGEAKAHGEVGSSEEYVWYGLVKISNISYNAKTASTKNQAIKNVESEFYKLKDEIEEFAGLYHYKYDLRLGVGPGLEKLSSFTLSRDRQNPMLLDYNSKKSTWHYASEKKIDKNEMQKIVNQLFDKANVDIDHNLSEVLLFREIQK